MTEHRTPGVALIGCGAWGQNHLRVLTELGALMAVADIDPLRRKSLEGVNARVTDALDDVLADETIEAVVIATPAATHAAIAAKCLQAGKDVLVEKPLALDIGEGRELLASADEAGRVLMIGHVLLFHPAVTKLRELAREGSLGRIRHVYSNRLNFGRIRTEESALWSFAPHDVAIMVDLLGTIPEAVSCHGSAYVTPKVADVTMTHLRFPAGVTGHIHVSWLHPFKEHRFIVVGDKRMAVFDDTAPWPEKLTLYEHGVDWVSGTVPVARKAAGEAVPLEAVEPLKLESQAFLDAIRSRHVDLGGGEGGLEVLRVLSAADRSLRQDGTLITVEEPSSFVHPTAVIDPGAELGEGTYVWHHAHVMSGARIGAVCVLGKNVFVGRNVHIGDGCKIQNNVSVFEGVELEDRVFCGPSVVFTNVRAPRAEIEQKEKFARTLVREGATLGANVTVVCGATIGRYAFAAAGAVVTKDVPDHALVMGSPARLVGWVCGCGQRLDDRDLVCRSCGSRYKKGEQGLGPHIAG